MASKVEAGAIDELADYRRLAPQAERAHPTEDHLVPFFVALGAGGFPARRIALGFDMGSLGMDCYAFGAVEATRLPSDPSSSEKPSSGEDRPRAGPPRSRRRTRRAAAGPRACPASMACA